MPNFIFCIHNHQPVGNFDHIIEESYQKTYLPFLQTFSGHPSIKLSFHITGHLLDWLVENHSEYIEMLCMMVEREQVEIMCGGYYEPILAVIPREDRAGQLRMMSDKLESIFNKRPLGMWLAERIWEPQLPLCLKEAGIEYAVVDDYHFIKAGLKKEDLTGYYVTEEMGATLKIFPGSERLRYLIPFQPADKFIEDIQRLSAFGQNAASIFADDGEKFGTWPGTHQWVYKEGWLSTFLDAIEKNRKIIKPVTFAEYIDKNEPLGRVYLPATSYMEMGEWALPPEASEAYISLIDQIKTWRDGDRIRRFLQGGFWRNFLAKYPEANWMHKRMLHVSGQCSSVNGQKNSPNAALATRHLYKAQCNDAYWHGIFGGLYLPHLRSAVYENLIKAENLLEAGVAGSVAQGAKALTLEPLNQGALEPYSEKDFDADTFNEILIRTPFLNLFMSPHGGGSIVELDYRPKAVNLSNTLSRWEEGYHGKIRLGGKSEGIWETKSIHELTKTKEEGLEKLLFFDRYKRMSLLDHFLKKEESLDAFRTSAYEELGDFFCMPYEKRLEAGGQGSGEGVRVALMRDGNIKGSAARIEKKISVKGNQIEIAYHVEKHTPTPKLSLKFGVEFNLILPCCNGQDGFYDIIGADIEERGLESTGEVHGVQEIALVDRWKGVRLTVRFDKAASVWRFPIETVSISESGFERVFQGSCLLFLWDISMEKTFGSNFRMKIESLE